MKRPEDTRNTLEATPKQSGQFQNSLHAPSALQAGGVGAGVTGSSAELVRRVGARVGLGDSGAVSPRGLAGPRVCSRFLQFRSQVVHKKEWGRGVTGTVKTTSRNTGVVAFLCNYREYLLASASLNSSTVCTRECSPGPVGGARKGTARRSFSGDTPGDLLWAFQGVLGCF